MPPLSLDAGATRIGPFLAFEAATLAELGNDLSIARMLTSLPHPLTAEQAAERIRRSAFAGRTGFRSAIRDGEGRLVGEIGLGPEPEPSVSFWIGRRHQRKGHAGRAVAIFADEMLRRFQVAALTADAYLDNAASIRVLEGAGFGAVGEADAGTPRRPGARLVLFRRPQIGGAP